MTRNCKTGLTLAFTEKITFAFSALALDLWPWLTGLGLDTYGLVNIPA